MDKDNLVPQKEQTFLESTIDRIASTNSSIESANNKLAEILTKLRGTVPSNLNPEKKSDYIDGHSHRIDSLLLETVDLLNTLHNQINELYKYI